jgi:hypothetical protein
LTGPKSSGSRIRLDFCGSRRLRVNLFSELHADALKGPIGAPAEEETGPSRCCARGRDCLLRRQERQEAAEREAYQDARLDELEPQGQPGSASVAAAPDTDALEKLAKLHEEGALTEEEFTAGKKEILGL